MNQKSYPISLNQFSNENHLNYHVINLKNFMLMRLFILFSFISVSGCG